MCPCDRAPALSSQDNRLFKLDPSLNQLADVGPKFMKESMSVDTVAGKGVYPAAALETAQRLLMGRWEEETRLKGRAWNLSQPVWHPTPAEANSSWSWEHLFVATRWLALGGKILLGVGGVYLAVRGGVLGAEALGMWKGMRTEEGSSITTRLIQVAKTMMCSHYSEGVTRGSRSCQNEPDSVDKDEAKEGGGKAFSLGQDS